MIFNPVFNQKSFNTILLRNKLLTFNLGLHSLPLKNFYSTSLPPLVINSTPDNLVFEQNKAGLFLPSMQSGDEIYSPFFDDLSKVYNNLEGEYRLNFFFYIKSSNKLSVYNFNLSNDCLYSNLATQGYFNLLSKDIEMDSSSL